MNRLDMAEKALALAHSPEQLPSKVLERARLYYQWLLAPTAAPDLDTNRANSARIDPLTAFVLQDQRSIADSHLKLVKRALRRTLPKMGAPKHRHASKAKSGAKRLRR